MPGSEAIILAAIVAFFAFFFTRMDKKMDKRDKAAEVRETVREKRAEERTEKLVKCRDLELSYMIAAGGLAEHIAECMQSSKECPACDPNDPNDPITQAKKHFSDRKHDLEKFYRTSTTEDNIKGAQRS